MKMKEEGETAAAAHDLSMVPYSTTTTEDQEEEVEDEAGEVDTKPMENNHRFVAEPVVKPMPNPTTTTVKESKVVVGGVIKYKECMRNHAASIGGHANDGCGEFMPSPFGGAKCVVCGCHRNFHRKEIQGGGGGGCVDHRRLLHPFFQNLNFPTVATTAAPTAPLPSAAVVAPAAPPPSMLIYNSMMGSNQQQWEKKKIGGGIGLGGGGGGGGGGYSSLSALSLQQHFHHHQHSRNGNRNDTGIFTSIDLRRSYINRDDNHTNEDQRSETPEERGDQSHHKQYHRHHHHRHRNSSNINKRFRTKFSVEQKEKMVEFAERFGWRLRRDDDVALNQFCLEVGVKKHVLRVWMHNNKNTLRIRNRLSSTPRHQPYDDALPHHLDPNHPPPPSSSSPPPPLAPPIIGV